MKTFGIFSRLGYVIFCSCDKRVDALGCSIHHSLEELHGTCSNTPLSNEMNTIYTHGHGHLCCLTSNINLLHKISLFVMKWRCKCKYRKHLIKDAFEKNVSSWFSKCYFASFLFVCFETHEMP